MTNADRHGKSINLHNDSSRGLAGSVNKVVIRDLRHDETNNGAACIMHISIRMRDAGYRHKCANNLYNSNSREVKHPSPILKDE